VDGRFWHAEEPREGTNSPSQMNESLTRHERLKKKKDISRVFASSNRVSCFGAKLLYRKNGLDRNRFMVTLIRNYGTAVQRNRAKRVTKEAFRRMKDSLETGYDLVVLLFPSPDTYDNRKSQLQTLFKKASLLAFSDTSATATLHT
jgi:ribonuclease P protein component